MEKRGLDINGILVVCGIAGVWESVARTLAAGSVLSTWEWHVCFAWELYK